MSRIRENRRGIVIQVQKTSDADAATAALSQARSESGAWAQALRVVFPIDRGQTREVFETCRRSGIVQVVSADLDRRIRVLFTQFTARPPAEAVAGGGPAATDEELLATFEDLAGVARRLLPTLAYAHVSVRPTFSGMRTGTWPGVVDNFLLA